MKFAVPSMASPLPDQGCRTCVILAADVAGKKGEVSYMRKEYTFQELIAITRRAIQAFTQVEQRSWTIEATMIELMKQVGDLSKHVMVMEKYYLPERATKQSLLYPI